MPKFLRQCQLHSETRRPEISTAPLNRCRSRHSSLLRACSTLNRIRCTDFQSTRGMHVDIVIHKIQKYPKSSRTQSWRLSILKSSPSVPDHHDSNSNSTNFYQIAHCKFLSSPNAKPTTYSKKRLTWQEIFNRKDQIRDWELTLILSNSFRFKQNDQRSYSTFKFKTPQISIGEFKSHFRRRSKNIPKTNDIAHQLQDTFNREDQIRDWDHQKNIFKTKTIDAPTEEEDARAPWLNAETFTAAAPATHAIA